MTDSIITAIEAAVAASPLDQSLLLHLAELYQKAERTKDCLTTCQKILAVNPAQISALKMANQCALSMDDEALANGYSTLLNALVANEQTPSAGTTPPEQPATITPTKSEQPKRVRGAQLRLVGEEDNADSFVEVEDSQIYLSDVGGMEAVKKRLQLSFLAPLKNPELMKAYGKSVRGGLLLYGPPGCGKTYIARALAGELGAKFITIGLNDILDMYIGESEKKLHQIFTTARQNSPAVLFIDEIDAIGQKRSQLKSTGLRTLVNQLLTEMDSMASDNQNLFVLAATNHPWDVDSALKRPGRFDRAVAVFPPDATARQTIFEYYLKDKPTSDDISLKPLIAQTHLFSGADIAHICNSAVEYALEASIDSGQMQTINQKILLRALKEHKASTISWFETARNFAMFANEGGSYDDLLQFIQEQKL